MAKLMIPSEKKGFSVVNGKVYEVKLKSYLHDFNNDENNRLVVENHGDICKVAVDNYYISVDDAKIGKEMPWGEYIFHSVGGAEVDNSFNVNFWLFENGTAKQKNFKLKTIQVDFEPTISAKSPDVPSNTYSSSDDCCMFNDVTVVHDDGKEEIVKGAGNLCMLTDEQRSVVDEIGKLLKKASDMGVRFTADWCGTYVFNVNNVEHYAVCYDETDCCFDSPEFVSLNKECFKAGFYFNVSSDDDKLWISRKKD